MLRFRSLLYENEHIIYKMYELRLNKGSFYRVKEGQSAEAVRREFGCPLIGEVFRGAIVCLPRGKFIEYVSKVGDTYSSVAQKFGIDENELKILNGAKPVYPTCRLLIPCK